MEAAGFAEGELAGLGGDAGLVLGGFVSGVCVCLRHVSVGRVEISLGGKERESAYVVVVE